MKMNEVDFVSISIAKKGYYNGDPRKIKEAPLTEILNILDYENFLADYEFASHNLNKNKK